MPGQPRTIEAPIPGPAQSQSFGLDPGVVFDLEAVYVEIDTSGAGGPVTAELTLLEQSGVVIAKKRQAETVDAGGSGSATWALRLDDEAAAAAGLPPWVPFNQKVTAGGVPIDHHHGGTGLDASAAAMQQSDTVPLTTLLGNFRAQIFDPTKVGGPGDDWEFAGTQAGTAIMLDLDEELTAIGSGYVWDDSTQTVYNFHVVSFGAGFRLLLDANGGWVGPGQPIVWDFNDYVTGTWETAIAVP